MPSKRKKNKRRMRRVQAQRLALDEQNEANHPVKASPGIAVSAPPLATPKKPAKTIAPVPVKIPQAIPIVVPIVETPKVEPKPVVKEPVVEPIPANVEAPKPESVLEQSRTETEIEARVGDEVEGPASVPREVPVIETPPVAAPTIKAVAEQETKFILPATEPAIEAVPPAEVPVVVPTEKEIQIVDTSVKKTETELMHDVCEPEPKLEPKLEPKPEPKPELKLELKLELRSKLKPESEPELKAEAETLAAEDAVMEVQVKMTTTEEISVPVMATTEELVVEELSTDQVSAEAEPFAGSVVTETVVESVTEAATEIPEPEQLIKEFSPAAPIVEGEDEGEVKVLDEEDAAAVPAEPVTAEKISDNIPDAPVKESKATVTKEKEATAGILVEDFVVTESVSAVEVAISASAAVQQEIVTTMETFSTQMKSIDVALADPEPAAAPAKDVIIEAAEQAGLEMLSEEPKPGIGDMPCQMQIPAEPVQLSSAEISMETALNGHIVPEVSIEG